jgi:hypothetical protein
MKRINCSSVKVLLLGAVVCLMIQCQAVKAEYVVGEPSPIGPPVIGGGVSISVNGLELYFADYNGSQLDLLVMTRATTDAGWGEPVSLGPVVNGTANDITPRISANGLELYFASNRGRTSGYGMYGYQIFVARRDTADDPWQSAENLGPMINSEKNQTIGSISADGLELYYSSLPVLRVATRETTDSAWTATRNITSLTDSRIVAQYPAISPGGLHLLFHTAWLPGHGKVDIYMMSRATINDDWGAPVNFDSSINSSQHDTIPWITYDGLSFLFASRTNVYQVPILSGADFFAFAEENARNPKPENKAMDLPQYETVLSWNAGSSAESYDVYVALSSDEVKDATADSASYLGRQFETRYSLNSLEFGQTYYWRVDEVNAAPDSTVFRGEVWSFTVEPLAKPVETIVATASAANSNMGPEKTIDGSGLNELDQHSTEAKEMWLANNGEECWIQYEFDNVYKLHEMWVWNSNQVIETFVGFGVKDAIIETSVDGISWTALADVSPFAQASGLPIYAANTLVDFTGIAAKYVRITPESSYGVMPQSGLSEVRFYAIPTAARNPSPAHGATTDSLDVALTWHAGREAVSHEVYLSTDIEAVTNGTAIVDIVTETNYIADSLSYGTTYYWKIIEVNNAETPATYTSDIWSFTTPSQD